MKRSGILILILLIISLLNISNAAVTSDEELEVILQFFEFDLEDICISKVDAQWNFLNGEESDLKKLLEIELKEAELYKNETRTLQEFSGKTFTSKRLQRLFNLFFYAGATLLPPAELKEYKEYSIKLQELSSKMSIGCPEETSKGNTKTEINGTEDKSKCIPKNAQQINKILAKEKDENKLRRLWNEWHEELELQNRKTKFDFMQQLSILDIEAELNEEDDLSTYWLKGADILEVDYHNITNLWKNIIPLYQKIRRYMATLIEKNYGKSVFIDNKLIPVHLLGSLKPEDWITAAEKLGAFNDLQTYKFLRSNLKKKNIEDLYKIADNFTSGLKMGELPQAFYNNSRFNVASAFCKEKTFDYCSRKNTFRAMSCLNDDATLTRFIQIHENVAKLKHHIIAGNEAQEDENGFFFTEGTRGSVIYEAVAGLSSLVALKPNNLKSQNLLKEATDSNEKMLSLLLSALNIIPALPYFLAADLWRINALKEIDATVGESTYEPSTTSWYSSTPLSSTENDASMDSEENSALIDARNSEEQNEKDLIKKVQPDSLSETSILNVIYSTEPTAIIPKVYDFANLTRDWWKYREQLQGIGNSDGKLFPDFLQDDRIVWNKPYISVFLGKILQFQLFEYFERENFTSNAAKIQSLLRLGKSRSFQEILLDLFNITEISTRPMLTYFRPLEEFLDSGANFREETNSIGDDLKLFSESYSMNTSLDEHAEEAQKGSNTIVFALLILIVLGIVIVTVFVTLRRYRRKQRAKERRKRQIEFGMK